MSLLGQIRRSAQHATQDKQVDCTRENQCGGRRRRRKSGQQHVQQDQEMEEKDEDEGKEGLTKGCRSNEAGVGLGSGADPGVHMLLYSL